MRQVKQALEAATPGPWDQNPFTPINIQLKSGLTIFYSGGRWMSAALDDPLACAECKQDFGAALQQFETLHKALEELNND